MGEEGMFSEEKCLRNKDVTRLVGGKEIYASRLELRHSNICVPSFHHQIPVLDALAQCLVASWRNISVTQNRKLAKWKLDFRCIDHWFVQNMGDIFMQTCLYIGTYIYVMKTGMSFIWSLSCWCIVQFSFYSFRCTWVVWIVHFRTVWGFACKTSFLLRGFVCCRMYHVQSQYVCLLCELSFIHRIFCRIQLTADDGSCIIGTLYLWRSSLFTLDDNDFVSEENKPRANVARSSRTLRIDGSDYI